MSPSLVCATHPSPIGELLLVGDRDGALHRLHMQDASRPPALDPGWEPDPAPLAPVAAQLAEYFAGRRRSFEVDLALSGSPFELTVWRALIEIPYATTVSYGALARRIGHPHAARAVGLANGRNPIAVIVPCHRVIGADGRLVGYGGGLARKRALLDHEAGALTL